MFGPVELIVVTFAFLLAGLAKGVVGLGFPTVVLGVLTAAIDLMTAMQLLIIPSLVTNFYQAIVGGNGRKIIGRIWPFMVIAAPMVWVGSRALTLVDLEVLSVLLGLLMIAYAVTSLSGLQFEIRSRNEPWAGLAFGAVNGVITGMTGTFMTPSVMYLQAIKLPRDTLVQAMGIVFTGLTLALAISLRSNALLAGNTILTSTFLLIPAVTGMILGSALRKRLPETRFRLVFFSAVLALGMYIVLQNLI